MPVRGILSLLSEEVSADVIVLGLSEWHHIPAVPNT